MPEDHIIEVALDVDENDALLDRTELRKYVKERIIDQERYYILLDEIQEVEGFERLLNGFLQMPNVDVYVTGSNSRFLSSEIATIFKDRGDEIRIHPLSFREFMSVYSGSRAEGWDDYLVYGGLPRVLSYESEEDKMDYLKRLFEETYLSDIVRRRKIKKREEMEALVNIMASAIGSFTNPTKLEHTFNSVKHVTLDHETIGQYIGYLKDVYLIGQASQYDVKGKKYISTLSKYYFEDTGLRNARLNFRQIEETHLMENIIYNELNIRGFSVDVGVVERFVKDEAGKTVRNTYEVDFVANRGSQRYYIQSALNLDGEKETQETRSLRAIDDSFKKIIIVKDDIKIRRDEDGIARIGIINFLLEENSLEL